MLIYIKFQLTGLHRNHQQNNTRNHTGPVAAVAGQDAVRQLSPHARFFNRRIKKIGLSVNNPKISRRIAMCSIIGYYGKKIAAPIIVKGLKRMEYRGYDSVGVATESKNKIELKKGKTPAQASLIEVDGKNKWKTIIQNASLNKTTE